MPPFRFLDPAPSDTSGRSSNLDGIRGYLALSVMIDHAIVTYRWLLSGDWVVPPATFYDQLGTMAVAMFFMITGYLFWRKVIRARGQPNFIKLYVNRFFRIAPVYLTAIAAMVFIVMYRTSFAIHQPLLDILKAVSEWSALGLLGGPDFNAYANVWIILAGVTWTLKYEWYFYFSLFLISRAATGIAGSLFPAAVIGLCLLGGKVWPGRDWYLAALFGAGMLVTALPRERLLTAHNALRSLIAIGILIILFLGWSTPFGPTQVLLELLFFYLICSDTTIFGLLRTRAAQRLGHISYSIYLLQGIVLTLVFAHPQVTAFALRSAANYWLVIFGSALALALLSAGSYVAIEKPGIALGRRLGSRACDPRSPASAHKG